jgi:predicted nucleic acid-binding protein
MAGDFLDTSALAKRYHAELGTSVVDEVWHNGERSLLISRLSVLEIISAFAGKVRAGLISQHDFDTLRRRFSSDLTKQKRPMAVRMLVRHYQEAERLLRQHGLVRKLRTLDALQLAVALDLRSRGIVDRFIAADKNLLAIAALEGFTILDPEGA